MEDGLGILGVVIALTGGSLVLSLWKIADAIARCGCP